ncbi:MAG: CHAT domain-containing protein, partial [Planctomycetes bacterium]|nr:CHAT domain-containing protein [Planctomycetota bacterium]
RRQLLACHASKGARAVIATKLAGACVWLPDATEANRYLAEAERLTRSPGLEILRLIARYARAQLRLQDGQWQAAYDELEELPELLRRAGAVETSGHALLAWAQLHLHVGLYADAEAQARAAARDFRRAESPQNVAIAHVIAASALAMRGRYRAARRLFRHAGQRLERFGNELWSCTCDIEEAACLTLAGDAREARARAKHAAQRALRVRVPMLSLQAYLVLAEASAAAGDPRACLLHARRAASIASPATYPWAWERLWLVRGRALLALGRRAAAARAFQESIRYLEQDRTRVASDELRIAVERRGASAAEELAALHLAEGSERGNLAAYAVIARGRAAALKNGQAERGREESTAERGGERSIRDRELLRHLYAKAFHPELPAPADPKLYARIAAHERRIAQRLRRSAPKRARAGDAERRARSAPAAPSRPPAGVAAVVEYAKLGDSIACFATTERGLAAYPRLCDAAELRVLARRTRTAMQEPAFLGPRARKSALAAGSDLLALLAKLYQSLLAPLEEILPAGPLVVIPSDSIFDVPFAALVTPRGYLASERRVTFAPHREAAFRAPRRARKRGRGTKLLFGLETPALGSIRGELRAIEEILGGTETYFGERAGVEAFRERAPAADLIHLATHAQFRADNPMWSALHFHGGTLLAWEIARLRLGARIAVLSACHTGRVAVQPGEELAGLARGFLMAGVETLVHSAWRVDDEAAAHLMAAFYRGLAAGAGAGAALEGAIRAQREIYPHPYYWAAFSLMGSSASRLEPPSERSARPRASRRRASAGAPKPPVKTGRGRL